MLRVSLLLLGLVLTAPLMADDLARDPLTLPALPEAISSFGAAADDNYIYVFGGHVGRIPGNSLDALSPHFVRLKKNDPQAKWEALPMQQSSQSPGLVAWKNKIYRVGGLSFKNKAEEDTLFNSLATFAQFDPETKQWKELPSLPAPRSSLDAAVVDGKLYVVGGWNLQDKNSMDAPWHEDAFVFDLEKPDAKWEPIAKPPFVTRALALAAHNHKLYVMGGMTSTNSTTRDVHVYDPQTNAWSVGPELPGKDGLAGFAISAFPAGGKLFFSGSEGVLFKLSDSGDGWQVVERLMFPRSFHRLLPISDKQLVAIAGVARGGGYLANLETIDVNQEGAPASKVAQWSVPFEGKSKHSQALLIHNASLYAFGGNASRSPHNFSQENILSEAFRFDLAARNVEQLHSLPKPMQSGAATVAGSRIDQSIYVIGGLTFADGDHRSTAAVQSYRVRSKSWSDDVKELPASRAMFGLAQVGDVAWIFGGSEVNTGSKGLSADTWSWKLGSDEQPQTVATGALNPPRRSYGGALLDGKYYAVGGLGADAKISAAATVFDFEKQTWSEVAKPVYARVFPSLVAAAGKLYLYGGFYFVDGHFSPATALEVYDPISNQWSVVNKALPFAQPSMVMLGYQDRLLFFAVDEKQDGVARFALLDPSPQAMNFGTEPSRTEEPSAASEMVSRLMRMDKNKDGKLTADEVGERFRPAIAKMDTDQDGVATKEEIEAYVRKETAPSTPRSPPR